MIGGRASEREQARRRKLASLASAVAVHALLAVFLLKEHPELFKPAVRPTPQPPLTIEIHRSRPAVVLPESDREEPLKEASRKAHVHVRRSALGAPRAGTPETGPKLSAGESPPGGPIAAPKTPAPEPPAGPTISPPGTLRLFDHDALSKTAGGGGPSGPGQGAGKGDENGPVAEAGRIKGRIDHDVGEFQARDRVNNSLFDPYFSHLRFGVHGDWKPTPGLVGGADGAGAMAGLSNLVGGWHAAGKQWAKTGSPYAEDETPQGLDHTSETKRDPAGNSGFNGGDFMARWNAGELAFVGGLVVLQLTQTPLGEPTALRVLKSSGYRAFDESAKAAVTRMAKGSLAPAHGLGLGGLTIESVWKMEARVVPYTCSFAPEPTGAGKGSGLGGIQCGGTFDLALKTFDPQLPLQTRVITRVELVAVYGGETSPVRLPAVH